jgi:hypothetical protein
MKRSVNIMLLAVIVTFSAGCTKSNMTQMVGSAIADGADTQVKYGAQACVYLQQRCVQGDFQEWETSNKEMGCSCKKM